MHDPIYEEQLFEWIGLSVLDSARISTSDNIDKYLCRYALPDAISLDEPYKSERQTMVHIRWHGFASTPFMQHIWLVLKVAVAEKSDSWFALTAITFEKSTFTVCCPDAQRLLLWECE